MQWGIVQSRVHAVIGALKPCLRVVGLAYAGLAGMLAMALVVTVALVPVAPALQQVAEPARQAVNNIVQPTSDAVTTFFGGGPIVHVEPVVHLAVHDQTPASDAISMDVTVADQVEATPLDEPARVVAAAVMRTPAARTQTSAPDEIDEVVGIEPVEISAPHPVVAIVQPEPTAVLQIASQDVPKALPTLPAPTETALQVKARRDVENQAAIDAAKAAQARAKAEADAANNAAIAARKSATATAIAASVTVASAAPTTAATPTATAAPSIAPTNVAKAIAASHLTPQSNPPGMHSANQAAIDAAKLAQARAKAEANAANQAAIDAAKGSRGSVKATSTPTPQPTPSPVHPTAQPAPTNSTVESQAPAVCVDVLDQQLDVDEASLDDAPLDQATTLAAAAAA